MTDPAGPSDTPSAPVVQPSLRRYTLWLLAASAVVSVAGYGWGGVDFAKAVLLGVAVVLLNFFWTKRTVRSVLFAGQPKALLLLSFLVKFGATGAVLYYAILRLEVSALGVLVGLSTVLLASVGFVLDGSAGRR